MTVTSWVTPRHSRSSLVPSSRLTSWRARRPDKPAPFGFLNHGIEPRLVSRLEPAVGQLLNAMREAADQKAPPIRRRLDPKVLAPQRLELSVAELRQAGDMLEDR
jgi:hypothetical protein